VETTGPKRNFFMDPFRVLDLTDEKGYMCGKILAGLGMDVIKVEPPGGDRGRNLGPFYGGVPHPERSLYWLAFNLDKRGITLNLETEDGREISRSWRRRPISSLSPLTRDTWRAWDWVILLSAGSILGLFLPPSPLSGRRVPTAASKDRTSCAGPAADICG